VDSLGIVCALEEAGQKSKCGDWKHWLVWVLIIIIGEVILSSASSQNGHAEILPRLLLLLAGVGAETTRKLCLDIRSRFS
jgi:hypothetical protein